MRCRTGLLFILLSFTSAGRADSAVVSLGHDLFSEPRLSRGSTLSCRSCHQPERAFTNGLAVAAGWNGSLGERNVPTLLGRDGTKGQFWDMRAASLEEQIGMVLTSPIEMGSPDLATVAQQLNAGEAYASRAQEAFGHPALKPDEIVQALAAYVRTLKAKPAPYDRYMAGDKNAISAEAVQGRELFFNKFRCDACHSGPNFTDEKRRPRCYPAASNLTQFQAPKENIALEMKTPTLRDLVFTGPYMHNGALKTLEDVIEFYTPSFQVGDDGKPDLKRPIVTVSAEEKRQLVEFLKSLSSDNAP